METVKDAHTYRTVIFVYCSDVQILLFFIGDKEHFTAAPHDAKLVAFLCIISKP